MTRGGVLRTAAAVSLLVGGAVAGLVVVVLHSLWWGMVLGIAATLAVLAALPGRWWARLPFAVGWAAAVGRLSASRAEGDYLIAGDLSGYVLLVTAFAVLVAGIVSLRPQRPPRVGDSSPDHSTS